MQEEDFERELKVLVVGNGGVGKTSMIRRFCKGMFTDEYKKTIGVDFLEKSLFVDALSEEVRFMLWDTAGQDEFDTIVRTYFRGAGAAVLAFSTTDRESFDAIRRWKERVESECGDIALVLVQNKIDLIDEAVASAEEVEGLARQLGLRLYRTCVKQNMNVSEVFTYLAELHQKKLNAGTLGRPVGGASNQASTSASVQQQQQQVHSNVSVGDQGPRNSGGVSVGQEQGYDDDHARTIELGPSKQRTKGKKSLKKTFSKKVKKMTACSIM